MHVTRDLTVHLWAELTWSQFPRSGSWLESVPPSRCGGRWVCSRSGCSGSAAPGPSFSDSLLMGCRRQNQVRYNHLHGGLGGGSAGHERNVTFTDSHSSQEHHTHTNQDFATHHLSVYFFKNWKTRWRKRSDEDWSSVKQIETVKLCPSTSLSSLAALRLSLCCLNVVLSRKLSPFIVDASWKWLTPS